MILLSTIKSKLDETTKFIFKTDTGYVVEFSYINKSDGKDIICVPSQTMCNMGCKFCHTTDYIGKIPALNLAGQTIYRGIKYIVEALELNQEVLLISYMGCGEPLCNVAEIVWSMNAVKNEYSDRYVRFAVATCIPKSNWLDFFKFITAIRDLPVKLHLSLHYTIDSHRQEWMPRSLDILPSLSAVDYYKKFTGNPVEIHYTLIEGVNDTEQDAILLSNFLKDKDINVKFLFFNKKDSLKAEASPRTKLTTFRRYLDKYSIQHEYYIPPGLDIGASCGQFLLDYYMENNNGN
jgi:23S rRNA (adenine2503-C2)-methyltransferase